MSVGSDSAREQEMNGQPVPAEITVKAVGTALQLIATPSGTHDAILTRFAARLRKQGWTVKNTGRGFFKVAFPPQA